MLWSPVSRTIWKGLGDVALEKTGKRCITGCGLCGFRSPYQVQFHTVLPKDHDVKFLATVLVSCLLVFQQDDHRLAFYNCIHTLQWNDFYVALVIVLFYSNRTVTKIPGALICIDLWDDFRNHRNPLMWQYGVLRTLLANRKMAQDEAFLWNSVPLKTLFEAPWMNYSLVSYKSKKIISIDSRDARLLCFYMPI